MCGSIRLVDSKTALEEPRIRPATTRDLDAVNAIYNYYVLYMQRMLAE